MVCKFVTPLSGQLVSICLGPTGCVVSCYRAKNLVSMGQDLANQVLVFFGQEIVCCLSILSVGASQLSVAAYVSIQMSG